MYWLLIEGDTKGECRPTHKTVANLANLVKVTYMGGAEETSIFLYTMS
jgi:hypothetical protein